MFNYLITIWTILIHSWTPNLGLNICRQRLKTTGAVVHKWSACSPSTPTIRVRIPLTPTVFPVKFVFEKNKKRPGLAHLKNTLYLSCCCSSCFLFFLSKRSFIIFSLLTFYVVWFLYLLTSIKWDIPCFFLNIIILFKYNFTEKLKTSVRFELELLE